MNQVRIVPQEWSDVGWCKLVRIQHLENGGAIQRLEKHRCCERRAEETTEHDWQNALDSAHLVL